MHKKIIWIATHTAFVASCLLLLSGMAIAATSVSIVPSVQTVATGEGFTVQVYVEPDTPIAGLQLDLTYDSSLVSAINVEEADLFTSSGSPVMFNPGTIDNTAGTVSQMYSTLITGGSITNEGVLCMLSFVAGQNNGICQLGITNLVIADTAGNQLPATNADAIVSIIGTSATDEDGSGNNDNEPELSITGIQIRGVNAQGNEHEETAFASIPDRTEEKSPEKAESSDFETTGMSEVAILLFIACVFFAIAFILDRKK